MPLSLGSVAPGPFDASGTANYLASPLPTPVNPTPPYLAPPRPTPVPPLRSDLARLAWTTAGWLADSRRGDESEVLQLYETAVAMCSSAPEAQSELCETHHAFATWLEARHREEQRRQHSAEAMIDKLSASQVA